MTKILIVDDHTLFRQGLVRLLLELCEDVNIREASDFAVVDSLLAVGSFDVVLMSLSDSDGLASLVSISRHSARTPVVVLSDGRDPDLSAAAIDAGASGFISKQCTQEQLLATLRQLLAVSCPKHCKSASCHPAEQSQFSEFHGRANIETLSDRQREVLQYLLLGNQNKAISAKMEISQNTVKAHLSAIYKTLGAQNRTEAVYFASRAGFPAP